MAARPVSRSKELRLMVLGHGANHIVRGFMTGHFSDQYDPTMGSWRCQKILQGTPVMLQIEDVTWLKDIPFNTALLRDHMQQVHALVHVLEPTRPKSSQTLEDIRFGELNAMFEDERQACGFQEAVIVLWREDERTTRSQEGDQWKAGMARGQRFAERARALGPLSAYADTGHGTDEAFMEVVNEVWKSLSSAQHIQAGMQEVDAHQGSWRMRKYGVKQMLEFFSQRFQSK